MPTARGEQYPVTQLFVHPVKSFKPIAVSEVQIDQHGLKYDRVLMLSTPTKDPGVHRFLTQRREPSMSQVSTYLQDSVLTISHAPSNAQLEIDLDRVPELADGAPTVTVDIWDEDTVCANIGPRVGFPKFWKAVMGEHKFADATMLAPVLRRNVNNLLGASQKKELHREVTSSFQDKYPAHLLGTQSLVDLNRRLEEQTDSDVQVVSENFRPNIVVKTSEEYEEDHWARVTIAGHDWLVGTLCPRCPMPTINLETGKFEKSKQPTPILNTYRRLDDAHNWPVFGISMVNVDLGYNIRVGDMLEVAETVQRY